MDGKIENRASMRRASDYRTIFDVRPMYQAIQIRRLEFEACDVKQKYS